jgi:hypothetical protein
MNDVDADAIRTRAAAMTFCLVCGARALMDDISCALIDQMPVFALEGRKKISQG